MIKLAWTEQSLVTGLVVKVGGGHGENEHVDIVPPQVPVTEASE